MLKIFVVVAVSAMIASTGISQTDEARPGRTPGALLRKFDTNGNGVLDPQERRRARAAMANARPNGNPAPTGRRLLQRFDADGDGKLSEPERRALRRELARRAVANAKQRRRPKGREAAAARPPLELPTRPARVDLTGLLAAFDTNRDGKLTGVERSRAFESYRSSVGPAARE